MNKAPLITVSNLKKFFPVREGILSRVSNYVKAVNDVSLDIEEGKTLGLVGESGSGKTTLGKTILRLLQPTEGKITYKGTDITSLNNKSLRDFRREMQIIFQNPYGSLNPRMSVESIVSEGIIIHRLLKKNEIRDYVVKLLAQVGLSSDILDRYPHEFSGGQRQRIAIARAIALKPKFIVCDEPVSALDVSVQAQIINLLEDLRSEWGLTYLFISHDLRVVNHISDRVAVMYLGKVVEIAKSRDIYEKPLHPYTKILISSITEINKESEMEGEENGLISEDIPSPIDIPSGCSFHPRCPVATEICKTVIPEMEEKALLHRVACHNI